MPDKENNVVTGCLVLAFGVSVIIATLASANDRMQSVSATPQEQVITSTPTAVQKIILPTPTPRPIVLPSPTPRPTADLYSTAPCGCSYDAYDCADFKDALGNVSVDGAQLCFNYCLDKTGGDPHHLIQDVPWDAYINTAYVCTDGRIKAEFEGLP